MGSFMVTLGGVAWCRKCLSNVEVDGGRMEADGGYDVALFCSVWIGLDGKLVGLFILGDLSQLILRLTGFLRLATSWI